MQEWKCRHDPAGVENAGVETSARSCRGGNCRRGNIGTVLQGMKMRVADKYGFKHNGLCSLHTTGLQT